MNGNLSMKGETVTINGDAWTVVDVAPAAPLAEMVASLLEEEGFIAMTRGPDSLTEGVMTLLGAQTIGTTYVLVPAQDAERALALIAETVTDYEGEDLDRYVEELAMAQEPEFVDEAGDDTADGQDDTLPDDALADHPEEDKPLIG
jgi:hypothetical protein